MPLVTRDMLESAFEDDALVTLEDDALDLIGHEPTREFLAGVGLPDQPGSWLELSEELCEGELKVGFPSTAAKHPGLDYDFGQWINVGGIPYDDIALDTSTGAVYSLPSDGGAPYLLNTGIETFAYFLYLLETERPNYDFEAGGETAEPGAQERLRVLMEAADPAAFTNPDSTWTTVLHHVSTNLQ